MKKKLFAFWNAVKPEPAYVKLLKSLLLVYILYTLARIIFFVFKYNYFSTVTIPDFLGYMFYGALYFDTVAIFYTNLAVIVLLTIPFQFRYSLWYQRIVAVLFVLCNAIGIMPNIADVAYYDFIQRRVNFSFFKEFEHQDNVDSLFAAFVIDYWYLYLIFFLFIAALIYGYIKRGFIVKKNHLVSTSVAYYTKASVYCVVSFLIFIIGVRGGVKTSTRPITMSNAGQYAKVSKDQNLILNSTFCILKTLGTQELPDANYFSDLDALNAVFTPVYTPLNTKETMHKMNVVLIIVESLGKEVCGYFTPLSAQRKLTPFLDSVCRNSLTFENSYANTRQSIDALPAILFSVPRFYEPFVTTQYYDDTMEGLPTLLKKEGYQTSFFHGSSYGAMGFWAFLQPNGVDNYYSQVEYNNDADFNGTWGISDDPFLRFTAQQLSQSSHSSQPFFSIIFTLSSHHPYKLPEGYTSPIDPTLSGQLKCVRYTDDALKNFFQSITNEAWTKNTLFIITGDHCQTFPQLPTYQTVRGLYKAPIIFYTPGGQLQKGLSQTLIQHTDITPTVMDILHYDKPFFTFGKSALREDSSHFVINFLNGNYIYIDHDYTMEFNPFDNKTIRLCDNAKDDLCENNLLTKEISPVVKKNETKVKAFVQQVITAVKQNKMTYKKFAK